MTCPSDRTGRETRRDVAAKLPGVAALRTVNMRGALVTGSSAYVSSGVRAFQESRLQRHLRHPMQIAVQRGNLRIRELRQSLPRPGSHGVELASPEAHTRPHELGERFGG